MADKILIDTEGEVTPAEVVMIETALTLAADFLIHEGLPTQGRRYIALANKLSSMRETNPTGTLVPLPF